MTSVLGKSLGDTSRFEMDLGKKFAEIQRAQSKPLPSRLVTPSEARPAIRAATTAPVVKQGDINYYAALNQFGLAFAHRRLDTEL